MKLELSFEEMLELQRRNLSLPSEVESLASSGEVIIVRLDVRERLPRLLRAVTPSIVVQLRFARFAAGRAGFRVETALKSLPVTALAQLLLKIVTLPSLRGVELTSEGEALWLWLDLQGVVNERVAGVVLRDFRFAEDRFTLEADVSGLVLPRNTA